MERMKKNEANVVAEQIRRFHFAQANPDEAVTRDHFVKTGYRYQTVYTMLKRILATGSAERKKPPGPKPTQNTPRKRKKVEIEYEKDPGLSNVRGALKLKIPVSTFRDIKATVGIKSYTKKSIPEYNEGQKARAKKACARFSRAKFRKCDGFFIIHDDETYVPLNSKLIPGRHFYSCKDPKKLSPEQKLKPKAKFPQKFCVWQALAEDGQVSTPWVAPGTIKGKDYLNECLRKRLVPWIKKNYPNKKIFFWQDMAKPHYSKEVLDFLRSQNIEFPTWKENAPNVPQARPIEKFWAICKHKYALRRVVARNRQDLAIKWRYLSYQVAKQSGANLMRGIRQKVREIGRGGVYALHK